MSVTATLLEDAHCSVGGTPTTNGTNTIVHTSGVTEYQSFYRFQLPIPRNAIISAAGIVWYYAATWSAEFALRLYAELIGNSPAFGPSEDLTARTRTTAYAQGTPPAAAAGGWAAGGIASIIQEVVNQSAWKYNNALTLIHQHVDCVKTDLEFKVAADEHASYPPMALIVEYTGGDAITKGSGSAGVLIF